MSTKVKNRKVTVKIGNQTTRLLVKMDQPINERDEFVDEFEGRDHNYNGLKGYAIDRAVTKLFGKKCFWFGDCDCLYRGQVFEALKNGNSSCTNVVCIDVIDGWE